MKLIFLYSSRGARNHDRWDSSKESKSSIAIQYKTDGYSYVFDRLIEKGVLDEVNTFVEVGRCHGHIKISDSHYVYAIPFINCVKSYVKPGDIFFVRGGWKHWASFHQLYYKRHWHMYYGAGTPRSNWAYWHVVFNDFVYSPRMGRHHPTVPFIKPIHPKIFYPIDSEKEYDVLLNSCFHIYDKKGQYKMINAAVKYKEMFGKDLIIALPGGVYKSNYTNQIPQIIKDYNLKVFRPGILARQDLNVLINKCKMYAHIGYGEQNARSALEAMRCNLPLYIASPRLWPSFVSNHPRVTRLCTQPNNPKQVAIEVHQMLQDISAGKYRDSSKHFENCNSPEFLIKQMTQLIEIMKKNPIPDQNILRTELGI